VKVVAISSTHEPQKLLQNAQQLGYITFMYQHADPKSVLLSDKFLYVQDDEELKEKIHLLTMDVTAQDAIRR
jgi:hypothetical protein